MPNMPLAFGTPVLSAIKKGRSRFNWNLNINTLFIKRITEPQMEIIPYQNGIHSLTEGLRDLNSFLNKDTNPFKMKEVVIKIHHGLETLFKDILF